MNMKQVCTLMSIALWLIMPSAADAIGTSLSSGIGESEVDEVEISEPLKDELIGRETARTLTEFDWMVKIRDEALKKEVDAAVGADREALLNQNRARLACFSLFAMMDLVGQVGKELSRISNDIHSSIDESLKVEEKIRLRTGFKRFLWGGEIEAARNLLTIVQKNEIMAKKLRDLQAISDAPAENVMLIGIQAKQIEQEQARLKILAENEMSKKGIVGWIKKIFS